MNHDARKTLERDRARRKAAESQNRIALAATTAAYERHNDRIARRYHGPLSVADGTGARCER
jgi:hypothetical protein